MKLLNVILNRIEEIFVSIAISLAVTLTFIEVVLRQFGSSLGITQELVNFLLIWTGLIGASIGVREKTHLGVDILISFFKPTTQKAVIFLTTLTNAIFSALIFILGYLHVSNIISFGQVTPEMEIPLYIPRLLIPIAFGLMTIRFLQETYKVGKTKAEELITSEADEILKKEGVTNE